MSKIRKLMNPKLSTSILAILILSACARGPGKPSPKFKIIEFFPPAGFSIPVTTFTIRIVFSRPLDEGTVTQENIKVLRNEIEISKKIEIVDRQKIEVIPSIFTSGKYKVVVSRNIKSFIGETLEEDFSWEFFVGGVTEGEVIVPPPQLPTLVKKIYPPHLGLARTDTIVYVIFSKQVANINTTNFFIQDLSGKIIESSLIYLEDESIAILKPKNPLLPSTYYIVNLKAGIVAIDGEKLTQDVVWLFRTIGEVSDTIPPEVIFISPENGEVNVPITTKILIIFSENIDSNSVPGNVKILEDGTKEIPYTYNYNPSIFSLTLNPAGLQLNKTYAIVIRNLRDLAGNVMTKDVLSYFSTGPTISIPPIPPPGGPDTTPPEVIQVQIDGRTVDLTKLFQGASTLPVIRILFSEKINPNSVNSTTVFLSDGVSLVPSVIAVDPELLSISLTPSSFLQLNKTYWLFITNGIEDLVGNNLTNPVTFAFTTFGISIVSPTENQYLREIINIEVQFSGTPKRIEIWIDSSRIRTITSPSNSPVVITEDTRAHPDGKKTIKAIGYYDNASVSFSVQVTFDNSPPSIAVQFPPAGAFLKGTTNIISLVNDSPDGILKKTELYIDGVFHSATTSPTIPPNIFSFTIDTTSLSDGNHSIEIKSEDIAGNRNSSGTIPIRVDNTPPTGSFVSPQDGAYVGGVVTIEASASDNIQVKRVRFFANSTLICDSINQNCEVSSPPYKILWNSTLISFSPTLLTGVVEDMAGNTFVFSRNITVDNIPPSVGINLPSPASYLRGITIVRISSSDPSSVTAISVFIDNTQIGSILNPPSPVDIPWNTLSFSDGAKNIRAVAYDKAGNSASHQIIAIVDNTPPSGSIISPPNGTYTNSSGVTIQVNATDNILVDKVEFFLDNNFKGSASSSPYSITVDIILEPEGTHSITAVVYDKAGNIFTTAPVTFIIDRTPPDVYFITPTTDQVVEGTQTVRAFSSDSNIVNIISISAGTNNLGSCTINSPSGTCIKNWATSGDADVILKAESKDKAGNTAITQIVVIVDNLFPSVSVTSPSDVYLVCPTSVVLGGSASDGNGITAVVIRLIDVSTLSVSASYVFSFNPATSPVSAFATPSPAECGSDGQKRVDVTAYDKGGKSKTASKFFRKDNTPPGITITFPPPNECVSSVTKISVSYCDDIFLKTLTFYVVDLASGTSTTIQSVNVGSSISCASPQTMSINWNSSNFANGQYAIKVVAVDGAQNSATQTVNIIIDNSPPTVTITNPSNNSSITAPIMVITTLGDAQCAPPTYPFRKVEYKIAVSGTSSFSSSIQDCSTTGRIPCTDTNVGSGTSSFTWSATEYCGFFKVKAVGYDYAGNSAEHTITVKIQPPGCPIEESWSPFSALSSIRNTPIIRDLNSDGKGEIIFGTDSGRVFAVSGVNGSAVAQNSSAVGSPIRVNLLEVVVSSLRRIIFGTGDTDRKIRALHTSPPLSDFAFVSTQTAIFSPAVTIFSDGSTSVIAVGDLAGRISIYEIGSSGFTLRSCLPAGTPLDCALNSTPITDMNNDSQPDILSTPLPIDLNQDGIYDTLIVTATDGYVTAIDIATRAKIWTYYTGSPLDTSPVLTDLNSDTIPEILVTTRGGGVCCFTTAGGICPGWQSTSNCISVGGQIWSEPAVADIDSCLGIGDTNKEIVVGNSGGNLIILSNQGFIKSQRNLGSPIVSTPALVDIDGDGCAEIFVATLNGRIHGLKLKNLSGSLYPDYITGFPVSTGGNISAKVSPILCNVDSDPNLELIVVNDAGLLRVFDLGVGASASTVKWLPGASFCELGVWGCQRRWESQICGY